MMARLLFPAKVLVGVLAAFAVWQGWVFPRPSPREYTAPEQAAVRKLCGDVVERLAHEYPEDKAVGVAHFLNDPSDGFTASMRAAAADKAGWRVEEASIIQRFLADITMAVKNATSLDEIVNAGRRVGIDIVIAGKVLDTGTADGEGMARAMVIAYDVRQGKAVLNESLSATWEPTLGSRLAGAFQGMNPLLRFVVWLSLVLLVPVATPFAVHWALARKSNAASFGLLAAYTAMDLVLALLFSGFRVQGAVGALGLCLAVAVCGAYNYWICEKIAKSGGSGL